MMINKRILLATAAALLLMGPVAAHAGDAKAGKKVFNKCKACHTIDKGGKNRVGPNLHGIVGAKAASVDGFKYSSAMQEWGGTWTEDNLAQYLEKPRKFIPKNRMAFPGLRKEADRANVIAYLKENM